jgi:hypothetical protein
MFGFRPPNTTRLGESFYPATVDSLWQKAAVVHGQDPNVFRKDRCGAWIMRSAYGSTSQYGWEIDHERPVAAGGSDDFSNLQPLHWRNNRGKGDSYPNWSCTVSAT